MKKLLITFLFFLSCIVYAGVIKETKNNTDIKVYTKDGGTVRQSFTFNYNGDYTLNGITHLETKRLLRNSTDDFPSTTNLYGNHINGTGSFDGSSYTGATALTAVGTWTTGTDRFGNTVYNNANGAACAYYNTTDLDTASEAFFQAGIFRQNDSFGSQVLFSKYDISSGNSYALQLASDHYVYATLCQNGTCYTKVLDEDHTRELSDGLRHFVLISYDPVNNQWLTMIDDRIATYWKQSSSLTRSNTSGAKVSFGAYDCSGTPSQYFKGTIEEAMYGRYFVTPDEARKLYCRALGNNCTVDGSKVYVNGKRRALYGRYPTSDESSFTDTATNTSNYWAYVAEEGGLWKAQASAYAYPSDNTSGLIVTYAYVDIYNSTQSERIDIANGGGSFTLSGDMTFCFNLRPSNYFRGYLYDLIRLRAYKHSLTNSLSLLYSSGEREPYFLLSKDM